MTEPQLSPGGQWWWTGEAWVAAADHPDGAAALAAQSAAPVAPAPAPVAHAAAPVGLAPDPVRVAPAPVVAAAPTPVVPVQPVAPPANQPAAPPPVADQPVFRPVGWKPPADPVAAAAAMPAQSPLATYAKPVGFALAAAAAVGIVVGVVLPAIHHTQKQVAATVQKPIVAAANIELKAVATNAAQAEAAAFAESNGYVGMAGLVAQGYRPTNGVTLTVVAADTDHFCFKLTGLAQSVAWYDSKTSAVSSKPCR